VRLHTQADVEALAGCKRVRWLGFYGEQIRDLSPLADLERVDTLLVFSGTELSELDGFDSLRSIGCGLLFYSNPNLQSLEGLASLERIEDGAWNDCPREVHLSRNDSLTSLHGLERLMAGNGPDLEWWIAGEAIEDLSVFAGVERVRHLELRSLPVHALAGLEDIREVTERLLLDDLVGTSGLGGLRNLETAAYIAIVDADDLRDLSGLDSLRSATSMYLSSNESLEDIGPLPALESLGSLTISRHPALASLSGLRNLTMIEDTLWIWQEPSLALLDDLASLETVGQTLWLDGNTALASLDGLSGLSTVGQELMVIHNSWLPQSEAEAWAAGVDAAFKKVDQNQGTEPYTDWCPYTEDGQCDWGIGVCPLLTDYVDCCENENNLGCP
jgi:hypothetical protein